MLVLLSYFQQCSGEEGGKGDENGSGDRTADGLEPPKSSVTSCPLMPRSRKGLTRYANCDGVFVLVCSGSLEANGVKKFIEIVYNLLIEPI
jgi:hypothetical protein